MEMLRTQYLASYRYKFAKHQMEL
ncbi:hypothetical protein Ccrd_024342 [Cynara cardunculus var. scolymus]|uniref:Uncharacterized protein n=1 Tax=Cynara cardunculus var. scolymus TaxID=59895 RepID=A0A124P3P2_CYNCS|nr:hypothetical protein Ccrd_024342 [Cynara cardunculus var. scolymus]